jgi:hypothetical protein
MTIQASSPGATARALWKRAPLWRFALMLAALLTLLFALFLPDAARHDSPAASVASYTRPPRLPTQQLPPTQAQSPPTQQLSSQPQSSQPRQQSQAPPKTARLSMATGNSNAPVGESGLDAAMLGRVYRDVVTIDGFTLKLPPGDWASLASSSITMPTAAGDAHFLGRIRNKRLVGAVRIFAVHSKDKPGEGFDEVKSCTEVNPGRTFVAIDDEMVPHGHQACWTIRSVYTTPWSQWADRAIKLSFIDRAAAGDMTAKEVTYPQDFIGLTFTRTEKWGLLEVMYLFSPDAEGISSNTVLSVREADWTPANIQRYPEKVAYIAKLKAWGLEFWPQFKAGFDRAAP